MVLSAFLEVSIIVSLALLVSLVMKMLKQPLIIGYIITGIIASPYIFDIISATHSFELLAHIGVAILLFMVGLNLNPKTVREVGKVSTITGLGQIVFTSIFGFLIALGLGFGVRESLYIAVALTFSSTIIILKLLSDKKDLQTLYGKISTGFLVVQDLAVIVIMMGLSAFQRSGPITDVIFTTVLKILGVALLLYIVTRFLLRRIQSFIASSQELLLLFAISWCFALAALFSYLNFSIEAGALLAGITLSTNNYRLEVASKLRPLRDFFIIIFFIVLGSQLTFDAFTQMILPALLFSLFVLVGNPLIVMALMGRLGYKKITSFKAGLTVAQISEFSLIFVALGVSLGHVREEILTYVTLIGLITIALSSYMILYSDKLFKWFSPYLSFFERKHVIERKRRDQHKPEVILFGYGGGGEQILKTLRKNKNNVVVVDYDPHVIEEVIRKRYKAVYADASNIETLDEFDFHSAKMVISAIDSDDVNLFLTKYIRDVNKNTLLVMVSSSAEHAIDLYEAGASSVLIPKHAGGHHISGLIQDFGFNGKHYNKQKLAHIKHLKKRRKKPKAAHR